MMTFVGVRLIKIWVLGLALVSLLVACESGPKVIWEKFSEETLIQNKTSGKPTLVYFYAAWCRPCMQLRSTTFSDPTVVSALENWNRLKADMSFRENKLTIQRDQEFGVNGLPMLLFYDSEGNEVLRRIGFVSAKSLLETIKKVELHSSDVRALES